MRITKVFIYRYNFDDERNTCHWMLSTSKEDMFSTDQSIELASLEDLHDWVAASGEVFNGILAVKEGYCKWYERIPLNEWEDDYDCGYELI